MTENIHPSLSGMTIPISQLRPLENNPRRGDIGAIISSFREFGQVTPIVVKDNGDSTFTVISGNHRLAAAKQMGWTELACIDFDGNDKSAIAFALADNKTSELGETDQSVLIEMINSISSDYVELFDKLGWDDFEIASLSVDEIRSSKNDNRSGYVAPPEVNPFKPQNDVAPSVEKNSNDENIYVASDEINETEAVTRGSSAVNIKGGEKAVVQYTLVFDDSSQQRDWYDFIRYIRNDPAYMGDTTAAKLIDFIRSHADF